ncbi:MAG: hypothetical protein SF162_05055 [bacterium]|nr:hypothetical protein [bacterium]
MRSQNSNRVIVGLFGLLLSACSALGGTDNSALTAEPIANGELIQDGTALRQLLNDQATQVAATAVAAETYVTERESINAQLLATMRAAIPPTQQIVQAPGQGTPNVNALPDVPGEGSGAAGQPGSMGSTNAGSVVNGTQFSAIQSTRQVNETDGCAVGSSTQFVTTDPEIYVTSRAFNITAGTVLSSVWRYEGEIVYEFSFTVNADDDDFCLWFSIDPATVPFTPGGWSVQLSADGTPLDPSVQFTITGS